MDERARGENDAPNRKSGANRRLHHQDFRPKKPSSRLPAKKLGLHQPAPPSLLSRHCTGAPQKGIDAPAAAGSRTAASAVTPSEGKTCRAGSDSTAHVTPPNVESVEDQQRRLHHPPLWVPNPSAAHEACAANNRSHADPMKRSPEARAAAGADPQPPPPDPVAETPDLGRPVPQQSPARPRPLDEEGGAPCREPPLLQNWINRGTLKRPQRRTQYSNASVNVYD